MRFTLAPETQDMPLISTACVNVWSLILWSPRNSLTGSVWLQLAQQDVVCVWNVMAHAQKPDFVFQRNRRVHLNWRRASVQSKTGRRGVHNSLQGLYCSCKPVLCSHVTFTGYPLHSLVSPSLPQPVRRCVPSHFIWSLYLVVTWSQMLYHWFVTSLFAFPVKFDCHGQLFVYTIWLPRTAVCIYNLTATDSCLYIQFDLQQRKQKFL